MPRMARISSCMYSRTPFGRSISTRHGVSSAPWSRHSGNGGRGSDCTACEAACHAACGSPGQSRRNSLRAMAASCPTHQVRKTCTGANLTLHGVSAQHAHEYRTLYRSHAHCQTRSIQLTKHLGCRNRSLFRDKSRAEKVILFCVLIGVSPAQGLLSEPWGDGWERASNILASAIFPPAKNGRSAH